VFIGTGAGVAEAMGASEKLKGNGISSSVWNAHSLKPFDGETTRKISQGAKLVVSVEDHSVIGGLGSCIAEAFSEITSHPKLLRIGCQDEFGESGEPAELYEKHGLSANQIFKRVTEAIGK
jgi:transketolase